MALTAREKAAAKRARYFGRAGYGKLYVGL